MNNLFNEDRYNDKEYVVFEEDWIGTKNLNLTRGQFDTLEQAITFCKDVYLNEPLYVAKSTEYYSGNYNYLYTIGEETE